MSDYFELLPEECLAIILNKVKSDTPGTYQRMIRPVCKRFLNYVRRNATKLTMLDTGALEVGFMFWTEYNGLKELEIDTRLFGFAEEVGLGKVSWEQLYISQFDEWDMELDDGLFLLDESKDSLRRIGFRVGLRTCDCGVADATWEQIERYLGLLKHNRLELFVGNLPMHPVRAMAGSELVRVLELDMVCEYASVAIPYVFPNLEELYIIDRDGPGDKDGEEAFLDVLGELTEADGEQFGDPWPEMGRLKQLTYVAQHHQWKQSDILAEDTFQCIARQAPNLVSANLRGMIHVDVAGRSLTRVVGSLCGLSKLEDLGLEIVGGEQLGTSELQIFVPLVQKRSLRTLVISGLREDQAELLRVGARNGLEFSTRFS